MKNLTHFLGTGLIIVVSAAHLSCTGMMACSLRGTCGGLPAGQVPDAGTTKTITEETDVYSLDVQYPVSAYPVVNERIQALIEAEIRSFQSHTGDVPPSPNRKNTLIIRYEIPESPDRVFPVVFHSYIFTGGAHGMTHVITRNYETPGGRVLTLDDLFRPKSDYLPVLSNIAVSELRAKLGVSADPDWIGRGAAPSPENFQHFSLTLDAVVFHFEQYAVAPYSAGIQTVEVPRSEIASLLRS